MDEAALQGDIFVTATGSIDVITIDHKLHMKDRAIGHFDHLSPTIGGFVDFLAANLVPAVEGKSGRAGGQRDKLPGRGRSPSSHGRPWHLGTPDITK